MAKVIITGIKGCGCYVTHEIHPLGAADVFEKLRKDPNITRIDSRLVLPPHPAQVKYPSLVKT